MNDSILTTPSRRTVARGAAWSLPVVALAAAAPKAAASPPPPAATDFGYSGPTTPKVGTVYTYSIYGLDEYGNEPAALPAGASITLPSDFTGPFTTNGVVTGNTTVTFPEGTTNGFIKGKFVTPNLSIEIVYAAPGLGSTTATGTTRP